MEIERVTHYVDNVLTQAEARMGLRNTRLLVAWYTNQKNDQSVVHSHPYHELVLPIGGSTVRYSIDGSVYLVHVGELIYFPAQIYHAGIFNIPASSILITTTLTVWSSRSTTPSGRPAAATQT